MSAAKTKAQGIIDDNAVGESRAPIPPKYPTVDTNCHVTAVFSKSWCPYCKASKQLLSEMGAKPYILELDQIGARHPSARRLRLRREETVEANSCLQMMVRNFKMPWRRSRVSARSPTSSSTTSISVATRTCRPSVTSCLVCSRMPMPFKETAEV